MKTLKIFPTLLFCFISFLTIGQDVYKTPSGKKYHLASCRMVENVSAKLVDKKANGFRGLTPCKICEPPIKSNLNTQLGFVDKAVGESVSVQCKGYTKKGTRCKHRTRLANGYCYQHPDQNKPASYYLKSNQKYQSSSSTTCGAKNKSGGYCKRKVKGGGRCYQH